VRVQAIEDPHKFTTKLLWGSGPADPHGIDAYVCQSGRRRHCSQFSVCPSVRLLHLRTRYFENERTDVDANRHKWSTEQEYATSNFGGQKVKGQYHTRPKIDLKAWRRHHSRLWVAVLLDTLIQSDCPVAHCSILCLKKRANFGKLYLLQAWTSFDDFRPTASAHFPCTFTFTSFICF